MEQNLGLRHDDVKPAFETSVDPTDAAPQVQHLERRAHVAKRLRSLAGPAARNAMSRKTVMPARSSATLG